MKNIIQEQVNKAYSELQKAVDTYNKETKERCQELNEAPCSVCGKKEFILKFRDVEGEVHGEISGSFNLFGGSIIGYVDGETHTNPILCCRNCQNERKIKIADTRSIQDNWNFQVPYMSTYYKLRSDTPKVSKWLQEYGLEVACELSKMICTEDCYELYEYSTDKYPRFTEKEFSWLGLAAKYGLTDNYIKHFKFPTYIFIPIMITLGIFGMFFALVILMLR